MSHESFRQVNPSIAISEHEYSRPPLELNRLPKQAMTAWRAQSMVQLPSGFIQPGGLNSRTRGENLSVQDENVS